MEELALPSRLKALRREKGLTQLDAARLLGVSNTTLCQYESGKRMPSYDLLCKLGSIFHCSTDYLLGLSDERATAQSPADESGLTEIELKTLSTLKQTDALFFSLFCDCVKLNDRDINTLRTIMTAYIADRHD